MEPGDELESGSLWGPITVDWRPGLYDPDLGSWVTTAALLGAAALAFAVFVRSSPHGHGGAGRALAWARSVVARRAAFPRDDAHRAALVWGALALFLLLLGLNKQLDLQTLFGELGRAAARVLGFWRERRVVQIAFLVVLAGAGLTAFVASLRWTRASSTSRGAGARARLGLVGAGLLAAFVVLRAGSFHKVDAWLGVEVGLHIARGLEIGGIALVALAAVLALRSGTAARASRGP